MREVALIKQELSSLKLDVASILEYKSRAENDFQAANSKAQALRKEIDQLNEEQVLVELARIQALKELQAIQAQRDEEARNHLAAMEAARKKVSEANQEIDTARDTEATLAVTLSDVEVLQVGLSFARVAGEKANTFAREDDSQASTFLLTSIHKELEQAKKEQASINKEGFQFMSSMDVIRNELGHVIEETTRLTMNEEKVDSTVRSLNSKLLRAKSKLEAVTATEEKAYSIASNLSATLEQLRAESETAKKDKDLIEEETTKIKSEMEKTESRMDLTEEKVRAAAQELEESKKSEALALERLGMLIERTVRDRTCASQHTSRITISKFEYDYLVGRANRAEEIADKKVAAAQAWIEALKASEKETIMRTGIANRQVREMRMQEEQQVFRTERSLSAKKKVEGELQGCRVAPGDTTNSEYLPLTLSRKSPWREKSNASPVGRPKLVRKSGSPAIRQTGRSSSISLKRRKSQRAMPGLSKLFSGKKPEDGEE